MSKLASVDLPEPPLLTPEQCGSFTGKTVAQLAQHRFHGDGPPFVKFGRSVRYRWSDVQAWLEASTRTQTGD